MLTLLHISDLHRTSDPRPSNEDLFTAVVSDAKRWEEDGIPVPDLIIVSGDLIQGAPIGSPCADAMIADQYREAGNFIRDLAGELVNSDLSRIIIVPGNHDVNWNRALAAMKPLDTCPRRIEVEAFRADSSVRWNWNEQRAYEIVDRELYNARFEFFRQFQKDFYAELNHNTLVQVNGDLIFAEYPDLKLAVAGFASWHGNDCFCQVGEIDSSMLSESRKLLENSQMPIAVAVWHHNVKGGPRSHDYMDQGFVHRLIDFGFTVGLHGHQHYPAASPFEMRLPNLTSMVVVGSGSLAVGDHDLPMGERRQFNVVVINPVCDEITIHVREMSPAGVFSASPRNDFGGNSFIKLKLPGARKVRHPTIASRLDEAMTAVKSKQYDQALLLLNQIPDSRLREKRQIMIEALNGLGDEEELIEFLDTPQNAREVVMLISMLLDNGQFDKAIERLEASRTILDTAIFEELSTTIETRRMIS